ncbi:sensor histidine kinase [Agromyces sp. NPDC056965]|uniref:sensor histidine kinase n=1 Tax=Agromyces sp. NPDC056965 TaxID=3345983 RepID=UPI0036256977
MTRQSLRVHPAVVEAVVLACAAADVLSSVPWETPLNTALGALAVIGLPLRRRLPWLSFVLTLPALFFTTTLVPVLIALFAVAVSRTPIWGTLIAGGIVFTSQLHLPWLSWEDPAGTTYTFLYAMMTAAAPVALGWLVRARAELSQSLDRLNAALANAQQLAEEEAIASERTRIAREMHDIVSHQVSLIAVQSGALQVSHPDPTVAEAARTIRSLATRTLDELRQMVSVLRAPDAGGALMAPQPTEADIPTLIDESGIPTVVDLELPSPLPPGAGRALYRVVQEALTNVRKHAPGATAEVRARSDGRMIRLTVSNSPPTRPPMNLPSSGHGLIGLRERAEVLHGSLESEAKPDGGFLVTFTFPVRAEPGSGS